MSKATESLPSWLDGVRLDALGLVAVVAMVTLVVVPFGISSFLLYTLTSILFLATITATWDFFTGLTGYFSFGHLFLVALGGYTSALLNAEAGVSMPVSILAATLLTGLVGTLIIAGPSLRLSGIYFAVITLILPIYGKNLVILFSNVTGGLGGYIFVSPLAATLSNAVPLDVSPDLLVYYLALANFLIIAGLLIMVSKSDLGLILRAIRQEELLVSSLGLNPTKFKVVGFSLTAFFTGFTGALWTHYLITLTPRLQLSIGIMIDIIVAATIGGLGTVVGPVLGMFILKLTEFGFHNIPELTIVKTTLGIDIVQFRRILTLVIALVFFYFYPRGVYPPLRQWLTSLDERLRGGEDT